MRYCSSPPLAHSLSFILLYHYTLLRLVVSVFFCFSSLSLLHIALLLVSVACFYYVIRANYTNGFLSRFFLSYFRSSLYFSLSIEMCVCMRRVSSTYTSRDQKRELNVLKQQISLATNEVQARVSIYIIIITTNILSNKRSANRRSIF